MNRNDEDSYFSESVSWIRAAVLTFFFGLVSGGVLIPLVHIVIFKQSDPFEHGWPLCLQVTALFLSLIIAISLRCTAIVALGILVGLLGWMLASAQVQYPVSSAFGLLIHGSIPGALGSAIAFVVLWTRARSPRSPAENNAVYPSGGSGGF